MKKLALLLVLALALVPVLASCSNGNTVAETETETETEVETVFVPEELKFTDLYKTDYVANENENFNITEGKLLEDLLNCTLSYVENGLYVFNGTTYNEGSVKMAIYNAKADKVVYKLVNEAIGTATVTTARVVTYSDVSFIIEEKTVTAVDGSTSTTYKLMNAAGTELATKEEKTFEISSLPNDLIAIDGEVYSNKNDTMTKLFKLGMKDIPSCDILTDKYNYVFSGSKTLVYDQNFDLVTYVKGDSNADDVNFFVLNNGNILIVNEYQLLDDAEEYDYAMGLEKFNVDYFIFNVESQETVYVELDFVIKYVVNARSYADEFGKLFAEGKIENLAYVAPIVNKTVSSNYEDFDLVNLSNELVITGVMKDLIPNQSNSMPQPVAENRFLVSNVAGQTFLVDKNGKIIGDVSNEASHLLPSAYDDVFASLLVDERGNVYDYDLNKLFSLEDETYDCLDGLLFETADGSSYAILTNTGFVALRVNPADVQNYYTTGDAICFYTYEEVGGEYANYVTLINETGATVLKIQTGTKSTSTGSISTYVEEIHGADEGILVTVRVDTTVDEYDGNGYYIGTTTTTTYKTYFCADNVPA